MSSFGDRSKYKFPIVSIGIVLRTIEREFEEGADLIMVKPEIFYFGVLNETSNLKFKRPKVANQASGEYAMIYNFSRKGSI